MEGVWLRRNFRLTKSLIISSGRLICANYCTRTTTHATTPTTSMAHQVDADLIPGLDSFNVNRYPALAAKAATSPGVVRSTLRLLLTYGFSPDAAAQVLRILLVIKCTILPAMSNLLLSNTICRFLIKTGIAFIKWTVASLRIGYWRCVRVVDSMPRFSVVPSSSIHNYWLHLVLKTSSTRLMPWTSGFPLIWSARI